MKPAIANLRLKFSMHQRFAGSKGQAIHLNGKCFITCASGVEVDLLDVPNLIVCASCETNGPFPTRYGSPLVIRGV